MLDECGQAAEEVDWAAVKADYEAEAEPIQLILARHRITQSQLRWRRTVENWRTRPRVAEPGLSGLARRPVDEAIAALARLIVAKVERLLAAPAPASADGAAEADGEADGAAAAAEVAAAPPAIAAEQTRELIDMAGATEGLMREVRLNRQRGQDAARKSSPRKAVGGGPSKEEETEAADEAFMRAELKRRTDVLAAALRRGEISLDRGDEGEETPGEA